MSYSDYFRDSLGVFRWTSNNAVVPEASIREKGIDKLPEYVESVQAEARSQETRQFVESYRRHQAKRRPSAEQMFEMRAAFGRGTTVVNVLTGRRTRL